jgi:plasmid stabilization system protein ParE
MAVIFNRLVQKDVWQILDFYEEESGEALADAFYRELMESVLNAEENPSRHHFLKEPLRRANLKRFPYHFIYRQIGKDIRVLVVRHHKRHPSVGMKRR